MYHLECPKCGKQFHNKNKLGVEQAIRMHDRQKHGTKHMRGNPGLGSTGKPKRKWTRRQAEGPVCRFCPVCGTPIATVQVAIQAALNIHNK